MKLWSGYMDPTMGAAVINDTCSINLDFGLLSSES